VHQAYDNYGHAGVDPEMGGGLCVVWCSVMFNFRAVMIICDTLAPQQEEEALGGFLRRIFFQICLTRVVVAVGKVYCLFLRTLTA
jgi:hypothetical protein